MYLMIDNYDSFVYNLRAYFEEAGHEILVVENDGITIGQIRQMKPEGIIISPGPKTPKDAGISAEVIRKFAGEIPDPWRLSRSSDDRLRGRCDCEKGDTPMHGKLSPLTHSGERLFRGLPQDFLVTRYHSLVIDEATLPQEYQVDARTEDQAVMAISHRTYPIYGVQFHPEAVLTQYGHELLENFHCICQQWQQERTEVCYA